jgi:hypothetical protein
MDPVRINSVTPSGEVPSMGEDRIGQEAHEPGTPAAVDQVNAL